MEVNSLKQHIAEIRSHKRYKIVVIATVGWLLVVGKPARILAQTIPASGTAAQVPADIPGAPKPSSPVAPIVNPQLPPLKHPQPLPPKEVSPLPPQLPIPPTVPTTRTLLLRQVEFTRSTIIKPQDLQRLAQPLLGHRVTFADLQALANRITQIYFSQGYLTSFAFLPPQRIEHGIVHIQMIEGRLAKIEVTGTRHLNPNYIKNRLRLGVTTPLNANSLEAQLRLLQLNPLFTKVTAALRSGTTVGESILLVRVQEAPLVTGTVGIDNNSPPSIAPEEVGVSLLDSDLSGRGDRLSAAYTVGTNFSNFAQAASNVYTFSYSVPINRMNGTVELLTQLDNNKVVAPQFVAFGLRGEAQLYDLRIRQPLLRTLRQEFALSLGFQIQGGQTFAFNHMLTSFGSGPHSGISRTRVLHFGQEYSERDATGAFIVQSQLNFGLGILGATLNPHPIPDGRFFSWDAQIERVQQLTRSNRLVLQGAVQLTPNSLLPFNSFVIGGGESVRGYRQNVRAGDNGLRFSLADEIALVQDHRGQTILQLSPFAEVGDVFNNPGNPNGRIHQGLLGSVGLGLAWQPIEGLNLQISYGYPLVHLKDKGNSLQDNGINFAVGYRF